MKTVLREQRLTSVLIALCTIALGFVLIMWPDTSLSVMCMVLGGILLLSGLLYVAVWFSGREKKTASSLFVIPGVILCGLGVWLMLSAQSVISLLQYVFGAILIFHGFLDLQGSVALITYKARNWWVDVLLGLATFGLGFLVISNPFKEFQTLIMVIGLALVYDGFTDLWMVLRLSIAHRAYRLAKEEEEEERLALEAAKEEAQREEAAAKEAAARAAEQEAAAQKSAEQETAAEAPQETAPEAAQETARPAPQQEEEELEPPSLLSFLLRKQKKPGEPK